MNKSTFKDIPIEVRDDCPPDTMFLVHGNFIQANPRRTVQPTNFKTLSPRQQLIGRIAANGIEVLLFIGFVLGCGFLGYLITIWLRLLGL